MATPPSSAALAGVRLPLPGGVRRGHAEVADPIRISSGNSDLDALLGGGFPRGRLIEITGPPSSGRTSLVYGALAAATARGEVAAIVDGGDHFDPSRAASAGIRLERVLWVRPSDPEQALRSTEILLGTRGFALVVLDLANGRRLPLAEKSAGVWPRLARRAAASGAALVLLGPTRLAEGFAALCLSLARRRAFWPDHRLRKRIFEGIDSEARVVRWRQGMAGGHVHLEIRSPIPCRR